MKDSSAPKNEILELVGAIVLVTQNAEHCLKAILPFTDASDPSMDAALSRHRKLNRRSLGELVKEFVGVTTSDSLAFSEHLALIVNDRNNIVHHFQETYGQLLAAGDTQRVVSSLRLQLASTNTLLNVLQQAALHLFEAMRDTTFSGSAEFQEIAELCANLREQLQANSSFKPSPLRGPA